APLRQARGTGGDGQEGEVGFEDGRLATGSERWRSCVRRRASLRRYRAPDFPGAVDRLSLAYAVREALKIVRLPIVDGAWGGASRPVFQRSIAAFACSVGVLLKGR